ncbi:MAG: ABC transporter substrate-binding protein [Betaproteobacteria bacterium AqS2]|uniref:ABC transporter substrate-binding protein n=1 Tax=Candidatus Amphirhobacter heronislandensis TaxID=1732024 RepID=A0A930XYI9_9GAMM|nr:ABC transporter substrate-binding protein [Betaproteobacteria bacterium AqS2]
MRKLAALLLAPLLCAAAGARAQSADEAAQAKEEAIQQAALEAVRELSELRAGGALNDASALALIQKTLSPHFDYGHLTRQAMGKYWSRANDEQRAVVTELFRAKIERTYAKSLSKFSDQNLAFPPAERQRNGDYRIGIDVEHDGSTVFLHFILTEARGEWTINDFLVENVSLVKNFRSQFYAIIRKEGVDGFIALLRREAAG